MNILFATSAAPEKNPFSTDEKRPPLGLGFLISIIRNAGHNVFFIDNYLAPSSFLEEGYLQANKIDFVAIHSNTICYRDTLRMFNMIEALRKKGEWNGKIIVGGPHTSVALDTIPDFVDFIVQGEGEVAILEIINGNAKERVIRKPRITDLDSLPFQPWDIFSKLPYHLFCGWFDEKPVYTMNTSRGCPFNCSFCSVCSIWGKNYTYLSADRIISEIEYLRNNYKAKGIYFREDHFTLSKKRTEDFCLKMIDRNINIAWACETRVDRISDNLAKLMSEAGCKAVYLGIESGSQKILDALNKGTTIEQIEKAIRYFKKYNINCYCSFIVGTPEETFEDFLLTRDLIKRLEPYSSGFNVFVGIPSSPLYNNILASKSYEYKDDIGALYMPGFDIKYKYFYNKNSNQCVDYVFKMRTDFDRKLQIEKYKNLIRKVFSRLTLTLSRKKGS